MEEKYSSAETLLEEGQDPDEKSSTFEEQIDSEKSENIKNDDKSLEINCIGDFDFEDTNRIDFQTNKRKT